LGVGFGVGFGVGVIVGLGRGREVIVGLALSAGCEAESSAAASTNVEDGSGLAAACDNVGKQGTKTITPKIINCLIAFIKFSIFTKINYLCKS
jgi:hypothetical protein